MTGSATTAGSAAPVNRADVGAPAASSARKSTAQAAQQFEAVFLAQMIQMASEGLESEGPFSGGHGEDMFRSILAENLGREMARTGGVGLSAAVSRTLTQMQEQ